MDDFPNPRYWFVINAEAIVQIDIASVDALDTLRLAMSARGTVFALARVKHELETDLARAGFIERLGQGRVFATLPTATAAYAEWCRVQHPELLPKLDIVPPPPES